MKAVALCLALVLSLLFVSCAREDPLAYQHKALSFSARLRYAETDIAALVTLAPKTGGERDATLVFREPHSLSGITCRYSRGVTTASANGVAVALPYSDLFCFLRLFDISAPLLAKETDGQSTRYRFGRGDEVYTVLFHNGDPLPAELLYEGDSGRIALSILP